MSSSRDISLFSFSHRDTPLDVRDELAFSEEEVTTFVPAARETLESEIAVLSTCNRTEFYVFGNGEAAWESLERLVKDKKEVAARHRIRPTQFMGRDAARHLFRVAASIESLALGEDQILSQVKEVHRRILEAGGKSPVLDRLYQYAIRVGKRVRSETSLCDGAVSISSAAVELARGIFGGFDELEIALVGAGETAASAAEHFKAAGGTSFVVVNRGEKRGQSLAAKYHGTYRPLSELEDVARTADIMVFATGSPTHLLEAKTMKGLMKKRAYQSIFIIDISNPRNVEPAVGNVSSIYLFNIDDLETVVQDNLKERQREIPAAEAIIEEVLDEWDAWMQTMRVRPTIAGLAQFYEGVRQQELEKHRVRLDSDEYERLDAFSKGLVKKLLHNPIMHLRQAVENQELTADEIELVQRLFDLRDD